VLTVQSLVYTLPSPFYSGKEPARSRGDGQGQLLETTDMMRSGRAEPLGWFLMGLVLLIGNSLRAGRGDLYNDSCQYLSVADNIRAGNGFRTSIVFYAENYHTGTLPAPQTVFPPGYSLVIAGLGLAGLKLETAALLVSLLSSAALLPLLILGGRLLGIHPWASRALAFLMLCNSAWWLLSIALLSEALFTLVTLATLLALLRAETLAADLPGRTGWLLAGAFLAAFAFWVRYAGAFLLAAIGLYYLGAFAARRSRRRFADMLLVGLATSIPTAILLARNWLLSGSLQGGNTNPVNHSFRELWSWFKSAVFRLCFGYHSSIHDVLPSSRFGLPCTLFFGLLAVGFVWHVASNRAVIRSKMKTPAVLFLGLYLVLYTAGVGYAAKTTAIDFDDPRLFYPVLPVVLLLLGCLFPADMRLPAPPQARSASDGTVPSLALRACGGAGVKFVAAVVLLGSAGLYISLHAKSWRENNLQTHGVSVQRWLEGTLADGVPLRDWIEDHIPPGDTIMALEGQECGYLLRRKTIAPAVLLYAKLPWTVSRTREVSAHYRARFLIVFPAAADFSQLAQESPFFSRLRDGDLPSWVHPTAQTRDCRIYRLDPGG
jgi:hypothetical protein